MPQIADKNRELWLWLFNDGGAWTAHDLAREFGREVDEMFRQLTGMAARKLIDRMPPTEGTRRLRYAVTGTCLVPLGMCVAEVQS